MSSILEQTIKYATETHRATNHLYDGKPYDFHLDMVYQVAKKFLYLIPQEAQEEVLCGCWVHDIIEDARETYNDVRKATNEQIAEYAYALTNEKGKSRAERANDKYYAGIRNMPYASFIKMCDRIANYQYSRQINSRMAKIYEGEHQAFVEKIYVPEIEELVKYMATLMDSSK